MTRTRRLPALGPRGEGWVAGQFLLLGLVAMLGVPGMRSLPPTSVGGWLRLAGGLALLGGGLFVGWRGARDLGPNLTALPKPGRDAQLVDRGTYGRIRHPLYAALLLVASGWSLATWSAGASVASLVLAGWLDLKARREEVWLRERFDQYAAYQRRTRRFIPGLY